MNWESIKDGLYYTFIANRDEKAAKLREDALRERKEALQRERRRTAPLTITNYDLKKEAILRKKREAEAKEEERRKAKERERDALGKRLVQEELADRARLKREGEAEAYERGKAARLKEFREKKRAEILETMKRESPPLDPKEVERKALKELEAKRLREQTGIGPLMRKIQKYYNRIRD